MRRTDLDALRILFCGSIIVAHALLVFAPDHIYHVVSHETSFVALVLYELIKVTTMPAFMLIAGWSAVRSLRHRSSAHFMWERVKRLLVPLLFGIATFGCIIKYIELSGGRSLSLAGMTQADNLRHMLQLDRAPTFLDFIPYYLTRFPLLTWSHLWFLAYLLLFSLVLLPALKALARRPPREVEPPAAIVYLPALVLAALLVFVGGYWPFLPRLVGDWGNLVFYAVCFLIGAMMAAWPGFETRLHRQLVPFLVLAVVGFVGLIHWGDSTPGRICAGLTSWLGTGALLAVAARHPPRPSPTLAWLSEAALPIYILHHAPLLMIAVAVLPLAVPIAVKIAIIAAGTAVVSLAAYQWLVRPWPPMRFLFGMSPRPAPASTARATTGAGPERSDGQTVASASSAGTSLSA